MQFAIREIKGQGWVEAEDATWVRLVGSNGVGPPGWRRRKRQRQIVRETKEVVSCMDPLGAEAALRA